ncbi:MAG: HAD family hydrolase [Candidatus Moranbacteria bacterium]|nr:HAD family hydrolase [Candidatus Moranbacteria bacterium]
MRKTRPKKAVFLDRDGTINVDSGYVFRIEDLEFEQNAILGLRTLQKAGYALFIVSNQSGIARGLYTEAEYHTFTAHLLEELECSGVRVEQSYYCPFHPDGTVPEYRLDSPLRKPAPGMLEQAAREFSIDKHRSFMVGDKQTDIEAGHRFGIRSVLVTTGKSDRDSDTPHKADLVASDLLEAARLIIDNEI